jgi:hypothetical protein
VVTLTVFNRGLISNSIEAVVWSWNCAVSSSVVPVWDQFHTISFGTGDARIIRFCPVFVVAACCATFMAGAVSDWLGVTFLRKAVGLDLFDLGGKQHNS